MLFYAVISYYFAILKSTLKEDQSKINKKKRNSDTDAIGLLDKSSIFVKKNRNYKLSKKKPARPKIEQNSIAFSILIVLKFLDKVSEIPQV